MTDEQIEEVIDLVNAGREADYVFAYALTESVKLARVWLPNHGPVRQERGYDFYLIFKEHQCVGAVFDMGEEDIHVFVKEDWRGQGIMSEALRSVVLPHFRHLGRLEQSATYRTKEARTLLEAIGFAIIDEENAHISLTSFSPLAPDMERRELISKARLSAMQDRIRMAAALINKTVDDCRTGFGSGLSDELEELAFGILDYVCTVEDQWWKEKAVSGESAEAEQP